MFGKNKNKIISAFHYEGLPDFATDYPCNVEITDNSLIITRKKPDVTVTVMFDKILAVSPIEEKDFMMKYHGHSDVKKIPGSRRHFVVIEYRSQSEEIKHFSLWALAHNAISLINLQKIKQNSGPISHTL